MKFSDVEEITVDLYSVDGHLETVNLFEYLDVSEFEDHVGEQIKREVFDGFMESLESGRFLRITTSNMSFKGIRVRDIDEFIVRVKYKEENENAN
ncbi:hypothetical protein PPK15_gp54 [Bacillus phage 000TH010]|uniref:Uncharacterized protein n=1 Tax=Bacillus phage 000TH010 TaxID=2601652 RepID=A0A5P8PHS0_9CAUD|nr:hypothetical protein PPK15_gp54 [Bacillus phage 000TH010]QFR56267.1 hypothetical protein 000TH010_54 [Bacillus phage 000TH010]